MIPRLHELTDDAVLNRPDFARVAGVRLKEALSGWTLHLRAPGTSGRRLYDAARSLAAEGFAEHLTVNDRVDIAAATGVPSVHLGQRSQDAPDARAVLASAGLAAARIGVSVHNLAEAVDARDGGADYVMAGHVFRTPSHTAQPRGPGLIVRLAQEPPPVIAVGGISPGRVGVLLRAGAHGVAVLRGVWDAPDPASALTHYLLRLPPTLPDVP